MGENMGSYVKQPFAIYVANEGNPPKKAKQGTLWYDSTNDKLYVLVGSAWKYFDADG